MFEYKVISLEIDEYGYIDIEQLRDNITCKTKLIAVTYISNVTGNIQPIKNIIDIAHQNGIKGFLNEVTIKLNKSVRFLNGINST